METVLSNFSEERTNNGFAFAGFNFPKYLWTLPRGSFADRIKRRKPVVCGDYYHAPKPQGRYSGMGFYLESDGMPGLRWQWADEVDSSIHHTGWFCDDFGDSKIRGIVMTLPHRRGFIAGWSMGENMASGIEYMVYEDAETAAQVADSIAENMAEKERKHLENEDEE